MNNQYNVPVFGFQIDGAKTGLAVGDTLAKLTGALDSGIFIFGSSTVKVNR